MLLQVKDTKLSWADAEARCQESDAHLAIIKSQATNDEVQKLVHGDSSWIGLSDEKASMTTLHSAHYSEKPSNTAYMFASRRRASGSVWTAPTSAAASAGGRRERRTGAPRRTAP